MLIRSRLLNSLTLKWFHLNRVYCIIISIIIDLKVRIKTTIRTDRSHLVILRNVRHKGANNRIMINRQISLIINLLIKDLRRHQDGISLGTKIVIVHIHYLWLITGRQTGLKNKVTLIKISEGIPFTYQMKKRLISWKFFQLVTLKQRQLLLQLFLVLDISQKEGEDQAICTTKMTQVIIK